MVILVADYAAGAAPLTLFLGLVGYVTDRASVCAGGAVQKGEAVFLAALGADLRLCSALLAREDAVKADSSQTAHLWRALLTALVLEEGGDFAIWFARFTTVFGARARGTVGRTLQASDAIEERSRWALGYA